VAARERGVADDVPSVLGVFLDHDFQLHDAITDPHIPPSFRQGPSVGRRSE
jgi:hypothetical protein